MVDCRGSGAQRPSPRLQPRVKAGPDAGPSVGATACAAPGWCLHWAEAAVSGAAPQTPHSLSVAPMAPGSAGLVLGRAQGSMQLALTKGICQADGNPGNTKGLLSAGRRAPLCAQGGQTAFQEAPQAGPPARQGFPDPSPTHYSFCPGRASCLFPAETMREEQAERGRERWRDKEGEMGPGRDRGRGTEGVGQS